MIDVDAVEKELMSQLEREGLSPFVDRSVSQFLDLDSEIAVQVVLRDASEGERITRMVAEFARRKELEGDCVDWLVRSQWRIKNVDSATTTHGTNGWPVAATEVPVILVSGEREATVRVLVTTLAIEILREIVGAPPDLRELVGSYVDSLLARGGSQAWNPLQRSILEINQDSAIRVYRLLAKTV